MASVEKCKEIARLLTKNYHINFGDPDVAGAWQLVFNGLTDVEMEVGWHRLVDEHRTGFPPHSGIYSGLSKRGRAQPKSGGIPGDRVSFTQDDEGYEYAEIMPEAPRSPQGTYLPPAEVERRMKQLGDIVAGKIKLPLSTGQQGVITREADPRNPAVLALRNKNREALGWPLLNDQGVEVKV